MERGSVRPMIARLASTARRVLSQWTAPTSPTPTQRYLRDDALHQEQRDAGLALGYALIDLVEHRKSRDSVTEEAMGAWDDQHARLVGTVGDAHRRAEAVRDICASSYGEALARDLHNTTLAWCVPMLRGLDNTPGPAVDVPWATQARNAAERHRSSSARTPTAC